MCLPFGTPKPPCKSAGKWHIRIYINVGVQKNESPPFWSLGQFPLSWGVCLKQSDCDGCFWFIFTPLNACSLPWRVKLKLQKHLAAVLVRQELALCRNRALHQEFLQLEAHMETTGWETIRKMEVTFYKT